MSLHIQFELNGRSTQAKIEPQARLIDTLRETLSHTGTKEGCGEGECGACTVLVDGRVINSCLYPAAEIDGAEVTTIEGLAEGGRHLSPIQSAFLESGGVQCGFCTPGMIMTTVGLLGENPDPSEEEVRDALTGNLCRCTGYVQIVDAIRLAARTLQEGKS